jgi:hypothetical protein
MVADVDARIAGRGLPSPTSPFPASRLGLGVHERGLPDVQQDLLQESEALLP